MKNGHKNGNGTVTEEVHASELSYRRLFEAAQDGILILNVDTGRIDDVNPFLYELLGFSREEMLGKTVGELSPFKDIEANKTMLERLQEKGYVRYEDLPLETRDGRHIAVEFVSNIYQAGDKKVIQCNIRDITERKETKQQLALLHTCIANLNDIVLITEANPIKEPGPCIAFANPAFERITGYTLAEALGRNPRFLQGEKTDRQVLHEIGEALEQQQPIRRQILNYGKDGCAYWLDMDIVPVFNPAGTCTHFVAIERDITEEKENKEQLLWRTACFEAQLHSARDAILLVDSKGKKLFQNQQMIDLWDIPKEFADDIDDRPQFQWVAAQVENPEQFTEKVNHLYTHPEEISHDELELLNGTVVDRYSAPVKGKDELYYGRIWTFRDITDHKRADAQIAEQAALLDEARDAILVRDLAGKILYWNKGAERLYGWSRQEAVGQNLTSVLYSDVKTFQKMTALTVKEGAWQSELRHLTKDRREIDLETRWTLIRDKEGHPKSILAINTDITEKKRLEAQFMRAQRMESIGILAGGIAHDLNNILTPILMSVELLSELSKDPQAKEILKTLEVVTKRGADIVRQVLSFARGVEGERVAVDPQRVLQDMENIVKDTFPKDIQLHFSVANDIWPILGDPTQVHQILLNLCVNARDAMPHGGSLTVSAENCVLDEHYVAMHGHAKSGRYVKLSVTDSGTGIPANLLEKIFEPFFTTKELNKGTGLGLSTVMGIVKSHEGIVDVTSKLGQGTTFNIHLPAMAIASEGNGKPSETSGLPRGNGETVLVVDDEPSILEITRQTLQTFGYQVLSAADGAEAVALYAEHRKEIAVVLTDMMMPVMGGAATIRALQRIEPTVKIVAASGLMTNGSGTQIPCPLVKHFLTKPYTAATLLTTIRAVLTEP